jgi:hypothetical protein
MGNARYIKVSGAKEIQAKFQRMEKEAPVAVAAGMFQAMQIIIRDAKARAPVESGTLRASGYVANPVISFSAGKVTVEAGFGGFAEAYVWRRHVENTTGERLFFQRALDAGRSTINAEVAKALAAFIRGQTVSLHRAGDIAATPWEGGDLRARKR